jgi:mannitol-1-/sugar-/sorbitol-6-phosphatase
MSWVMSVAAVLFDLDGVLVNSSRSIEHHWRVWAAAHAVNVDEILRVAHGRRTVDTIRLVAPTLDAEAEVAHLAKNEASDLDGVEPVSGAGQLAASLPVDRWAIVTSGTRAVAEARLRHVDILIPGVLVSAEMVSQGKPDPEGYRTAAGRLGVDPPECVVIEDSPAGLEAARAAGMTSIAVCTTHGRDQLGGATHIVEQLDEIHATFESGRIVLRHDGGSAGRGAAL